jgi:cytochrome c-type biogenesis protein CcmH/NrfG
MSRKKTFIRILTILSAVSFLGSTGFALVQMLTDSAEPPQAATENQSQINDPLQQQERGYELVLAREPENQTALEGLAETRLQRKNFQGAIEPVETLIKLYPEKEEYKTLLASIQQDIEQNKKTGNSDR